MRTQNKQKTDLGFGLGLRCDHYEDIIRQKLPVDWFEILTENYLEPGGKPQYYLEKIRANYPLAMHGVSLSIGSIDPLDMSYLQQVKTLAKRITPAWISDHLCWTGVAGKNMHDLLPLPYTDETIQHVVERIQQVQDFLGQQILIENVSSYITYQQSKMPEWEFLKTISEQANCLILLDINNIYVSATNHAFNPMEYINAIPVERVFQFHLAGHSDMGDYLIDTHDEAIGSPVWDLYKVAVQRFGKVATMIERDANMPLLETLLEELNQARKIAHSLPMESVA